MPSAWDLLARLDRRTIAQKIEAPFALARARFYWPQNTVQDYEEFMRLLTDYGRYLCVSCMGWESASEHMAFATAEEALVRAYRERNGDYLTAISDAQQGTNGGVRGILDAITEVIKRDNVEKYINYVFTDYVDYPVVIQTLREFFAAHGHELPSVVDTRNPERYVRYFKKLMRSFAEGRNDIIVHLEAQD